MRNKFSLSHTRLLTCDMGELVPIGLTEILPGDSVQHSCSALVRAAPLTAPPMHPLEVRIHHWFVPARLVWDNFDDMITGGPAGTSLPPYPTVNFASAIAVGTLADYFGLPTGTAGLTLSAIPFRMYQLIWNEWYRDQDLETAAVISTADGADTTTDRNMKNCAWEKDYFTSSRPWEQKGPAISIPLGTTAPVVFTEGGTSPGTRTLLRAAGGAGTSLNIVEAGTASDPITAAANLSGASTITVNALRTAMALQRYEENRARYGSRYVEYLRMLGIKSSDARLQRPEFLGGGKQLVQFSEVLTTGVNGTDPVGTMKGHGITAMRSNRYRRFFEEHGYIMSLMSTRPKTMYLSGLPRTFNRRAKEDYWQPELQHLGQQAVLNKEVYAAHATPDGTFGYQDRYDEYRRMESGVSGEFRTTLNNWHFARAFGSTPALNATFVSCVPPETPFAAPASDVLWIMAKHSIQARRLVTPVGKSFIF